jgi:S1-C subfamily serine protease
VKLHVVRDGAPREIALTLARQPDQPNAAGPRRLLEREVSPLGLYARTLLPSLVRYTRVNEDVRGVQVVESAENGPLAGAVQSGDIIVGCNGRDVASIRDLQQALDADRKRAALKILDAQQKLRTVTVTRK